jgi:hypothetical protein
MADDQAKLEQALDQLSAQLGEIRKLNPSLADQLATTIAGAKAAIEKGEATEEDHQTLAGELSDALMKFEAAHPTLTGNLGSVIDALGRLGI